MIRKKQGGGREKLLSRPSRWSNLLFFSLEIYTHTQRLEIGVSRRSNVRLFSDRLLSLPVHTCKPLLACGWISRRSKPLTCITSFAESSRGLFLRKFPRFLSNRSTLSFSIHFPILLAILLRDNFHAQFIHVYIFPAYDRRRNFQLCKITLLLLFHCFLFLTRQTTCFATCIKYNFNLFVIEFELKLLCRFVERRI